MSKRIEFFQSKKNHRWIFNMKYDSEKVVSCTSGFERINHAFINEKNKTHPNEKERIKESRKE